MPPEVPPGMPPIVAPPGNAARGAAWDAAYIAAWNAARDAARDAARNAAWWAAWNAAQNAARDAIQALVAYDHAGALFDIPVEQVRVQAYLGQPAAILMLPAVNIKRNYYGDGNLAAGIFPRTKLKC